MEQRPGGIEYRDGPAPRIVFVVDGDLDTSHFRLRVGPGEITYLPMNSRIRIERGHDELGPIQWFIVEDCRKVADTRSVWRRIADWLGIGAAPRVEISS